MSHEIVPAEEVYYDAQPSTSYSAAAKYDSASAPFRRQRSLTYGDGADRYAPEPFDSERLPATLASEIQRFLRVANLLDSEEPRISYLCMLYLAFFFCFRFLE